MPTIIPTLPKASQTISISLDNQQCQINVYQKFYGLFVDLYINDVIVVGGVLGEDRNRIVRSVYLGFLGDLTFYDTQGAENPDYTGLGDRFQLAYLSLDDLANMGLVG